MPAAAVSRIPEARPRYPQPVPCATARRTLSLCPVTRPRGLGPGALLLPPALPSARPRPLAALCSGSSRRPGGASAPQPPPPPPTRRRPRDEPAAAALARGGYAAAGGGHGCAAGALRARSLRLRGAAAEAELPQRLRARRTRLPGRPGGGGGLLGGLVGAAARLAALRAGLREAAACGQRPGADLRHGPAAAGLAAARGSRLPYLRHPGDFRRGGDPAAGTRERAGGERRGRAAARGEPAVGRRGGRVAAPGAGGCGLLPAALPAPGLRAQHLGAARVEQLAHPGRQGRPRRPPLRHGLLPVLPGRAATPRLRGRAGGDGLPGESAVPPSRGAAAAGGPLGAQASRCARFQYRQGR